MAAPTDMQQSLWFEVTYHSFKPDFAATLVKRKKTESIKDLLVKVRVCDMSRVREKKLSAVATNLTVSSYKPASWLRMNFFTHMELHCSRVVHTRTSSL